MIERELSFAKLTVRAAKLGNDYHIVISGGERPHIGCTVLAVPRPSLTGDGTISVTSSVLNVTGHKDEELCRYLAETVAKCRQGVTVCTGGVHIDHASAEQIREVAETVQRIADEIGKGSIACEFDAGK